MPSPFPGMDPYLEDPFEWPGFHDALVSYLREWLQPLLPPEYYADINTREGVSISGETFARYIRPDVTIAADEAGTEQNEQQVAVLEAVEATEPMRFWVPVVESRQSYVEIRDLRRDRKVVTIIEVISASNKIPGPDRDRYVQKQTEILHSDTALVEIDLLRAGKRVLLDPLLIELNRRQPRYDYVATSNRPGDRRGEDFGYDVHAFTVRDSLPKMKIPLAGEDPDVLLDLRAAFDRAYDTGPYRKSVDYTRPPEPPLDPDDVDWANEIRRRRGLR